MRYVYRLCGARKPTCALRVACWLPAHALPAPIAEIIASMALAALGLSGEPFHERFHAWGGGVRQLGTTRNDRSAGLELTRSEDIADVNNLLP